MALPAGVSTCRVDLRLIKAVVDASDPDRDPDGVPVEGAKVVFRSSLNPPVARVPSATPPTVISVAPITVFTNADGRIVSPDGQLGVYLIASADEDLDPHGWPWTVTITKPEDGISITTSFVTTPGGEIDLGSVVPVPPNPGTALLQWETAVTEAQAARADAIAAKLAAEDIAAGINPTVPVVPSTVPQRSASGQLSDVELIARYPLGAAHATVTIASAFPSVTLAEVQALDAAATLSDTADWYALASFVAQCAAAKTKSIRIPEGTYYVSRRIDLSGLEYGANVDARGVILRPTQQMTEVVLLEHRGNYWKGRRCTIRELEIRGNYHPDAGIRIVGVQEWALDSVRVHQCYEGLSLADTWYGDIRGETVVQDCLTGVYFDAVATAEINTIGLSNVKINFTPSLKANFTRVTSPEAVGVAIAVIMGGINFDGWVIEGVDVGFKYVAKLPGSGQQRGRFSVTACYFENINTRFFDFSAMATPGFIVNKNDITISGCRFLPKAGASESIFSTGSHRIVGNQPFSMRLIQAATSSRIHAVLDEDVTLLNEYATSDPQTLVYRVQSTPTNKYWQRFGAWGDKNVFPNNDGMVGTMGAANYLIGPSATNLRGTNAPPSKWYEVRTLQPRPVVFYPLNDEPNGPVLRGADGLWYMLLVGAGGTLTTRQVSNMHRLDESPAHRTAKELWYSTTLALGTKFFCVDLVGTEVTLTDVGGGVRRWCDSSGRVRIAATPELLSGAAALPNGANVYDVNTSQVAYASTGVLRYRSWFGAMNNDRVAGTTAQRPAAPVEEGFIYYDTDTSTYTRWTAGAYVAFTPNNTA